MRLAHRRERDVTSRPVVATSFRADIQGVRAVAVLLVVVHHLGGLGLPGGLALPGATSGSTSSSSCRVI